MTPERRPVGLRTSVLALATALASSSLFRTAAADNILQTSGFNTCGNNTDISVQKVDITYNSSNQTVAFDVAGTSSKLQNVTAILNVTAYGIQVYSNAFNPCDAGTFVAQLCPVPVGSFSARGVQLIPAQYANLVPSAAFKVPDIDAQATLQLMAAGSDSDNAQVACIQSHVTNGKTADIPAVSYVAAGVVGAALVLSGVGAVGAAISGGGSAVAGSSSAAGMGTISPSFGEVLGWFQGMAMNSMLSVSYPQVYRSFAKNFAFSTGLIPWTNLQIAIDNFRVATGGNLTNDSVHFLQNATLVFPGDAAHAPDSAPDSAASFAARRVHSLLLRAIETSVNGTDGTGAIDNIGDLGDGSVASSVRVAVTGIRAYVEELSIPSASTFMTVLLIVAIVIAAITVGLLLVKVVLEAWALIGSFPASLADFRQHYWRSIARAITTLILLLYGIWVLYCMFQFTQGDSWAARVLAGVTLALFTGVLAFFSYKIWHTAQALKHQQGDASGLYDDHTIWSKYSLFYESYRKQYWWVFVPAIMYMFAKGVALAVGDGHGMAQTIAQLVIEAGMLLLLLWSRPYERRSGNVVNIVIQVVRVLSVVCILIFVEEFGIAETTQTVAGVVLIAVQSALSSILAMLIAYNALSACCKKNPHELRRREMQQKVRAADDLTPLDARNSLLRGKTPIPDEEAPVRVDEKSRSSFEFPAAAAAVSADAAASKMMPAGFSTTAIAASSEPSWAAAPRMPPSTTIGVATSAPETRSLTPANGARRQNKSIDRSNDRNSLLDDMAPMGQSAPAGVQRQQQPARPSIGPRPSTNRSYPLRSSTYSPFPAQRSGAGDPNAQYRAYNADSSSRGYGPYRGPATGY